MVNRVQIRCIEKTLGWSDLLVEAGQLTFRKLMEKNRKAFHSNAALSMKPRPMEVRK